MEEKDKPDPQPIFEPADEDRPASAAPTEQQLTQEVPAVASLDRSPAPTPHDAYAAWRIPAYRYYGASYALAIIGGQIESVAVAWQVFTKTGSALHLGLIGGVQVIPLLVLALPAGHVADTVSRKKLLILTQWALAFWGLALAYLSYYHEGASWFVPSIYAVILLNAVTLTFARPARAALLPNIVPKQAFNNAVTWNASTFELSSVIGPAIGGLVVGYASSTLAYLLNAAMLTACALLTLKLPDPPVEQKGSGAPGFAALSAGVRFVWSRKLLLSVMSMDMFAVLLGGAVYLLPIFAKEILHAGATGFGWLRAAPPIGAFTMALIQAHRPPMKRAGRALLIAVAGFGVATIVFGFSKSFPLSFAMLILIGAFDNISVVVRHTLFQLLTPDAMRGRVSAVNQVFIGSSNELGGMESGLTAAWWGPVRSVVFGGIGTIVTVAVTAMLSRQLRKLGRLDEVKPEPMDDDLTGGVRGFEVAGAGKDRGSAVK